MRCGRVGLLVDRYVDGQLPPDLAAAVQAHERDCALCTRRIAAARRLAGFLAAEHSPRAPAGFHDRVMAAVYREALKASLEQETAAEPASDRARTFRRLGLSFMLSAAVLIVSLVVPRGLYPIPLRPENVEAELDRGAPLVVKDALDGAGEAVQRMLHRGGISR